MNKYATAIFVYKPIFHTSEDCSATSDWWWFSDGFEYTSKEENDLEKQRIYVLVYKNKD